MKLHWLAEKLEWIEEKSKPLFVVGALLLYGYSLVQLMLEMDLGTDLSRFLVEALANLSIPFAVILLHGLLELTASISHSNLRSAQCQFEIVLLVVVRSFFVDFAEVNTVVGESLFAEPVQKAVVKVLAIVMMTGLIIYFKRWSEDRTLDQYIDKGRRLNHYKQLVVVALVLIILFNMLEVNHFFNNITFISLIFTGLIVIDAIFLILSIFSDSQFDAVAFESGLVIGLIFARFPLFTSNILSYSLAMLGVAFATVSLYLLRWSRRLLVAKQG